jgi:BASS family bile acid:Na+ symporter
MRIRGVLENYRVMMLLGLATGVAVGGFPAYTKEISMVSLALLMTVSLSTVNLGEVRAGTHGRDSLAMLLLNYGLLTGVILAIALAFDGELRMGWILMAAAPSAISIVPFTSIMKGETSKALFSTSVNYVAALALMPAICILAIGASVSVWALLTSLLLLIVLPMIGSRAVRRARPSDSSRSITMNIAFFVLIFAVAGSNRNAFVDDPTMVMVISAFCAARTFGTGLLVELSLRARKVPRRERVHKVLFTSYKNLGLTATLAIALFEPLVAVPATICIVFEVMWVIFLLRYYERMDD